MKRLRFLLILIAVVSCQDGQDFEATVTPYPNPIHNFLNIEINLENESDLTIWIAGRKEMTAQTSMPTLQPSDNEALIDGSYNAGQHSFQIDMTEQNPGIYLLDVSVNGVVKRFRIIRKKN